ncbi:MAG: hypothetical protein A2101_04205 [Spirochaetes bacterium GWF2_52_7]|nr:MAG: hypothetical protein A2101_04205 [Spirochaetes bacterium GWF2_52_7]
MLKAGFAEKILEIAPGQPLMGHTRDTYAATGTHDSLLCKAIVWQDEVHTTGFIALDLCMVDASFVIEAKSTITRLTGVDGDSFLICATHTHAGPAVFSLYEAPVMEETVRQELIRIIAQSAWEGLETLQPVEFRFGTASCMESIGFNRRLECLDGTVAMNWELLDPDEVVGPLGPVESIVRVVEMIGESLHVCLVNYPLHPAILDYTNSLYSRDFPGYLEIALRQIVGEDLHVVFANGCCGDINHIDYLDHDMPRRGHAASQRVGYILAAAGAQALRSARPLEANTTEREVNTISLPRIQIPRDLLDRAKDCVVNAHAEQEAATDGLPFVLQAPMILDLGSFQDSLLATTISVTRIGPIHVFAFPGEVTYKIQARLGEVLGDVPWIAVELADDAIGYIAHREAYPQGGYEVQVGATKVAAGAAEYMLEQSVSIYRRLAGKMWSTHEKEVFHGK